MRCARALLGTAVVPALIAGAAREAAARQPALAAVPRAPLAVRPGQRLRLRVAARNGGRAWTRVTRLAILLSDDARPGAGDLAVGRVRVARLRPRSRRRVPIAVRVPADVAMDRAYRLIACLGRPSLRSCRVLPGRTAALRGSSHDVIDGALDLGIISKDRSLAYKLMATLRVPGLPGGLRGDGSRTELTETMAEARRRLPRMPRSLRRKVQPLLAPPMYRPAPGASKGRRVRKPRARAAAEFHPCDVRYGQWSSVKAGELPARVWWRKDHDHGAAARRIAAAIASDVWTPLTGLLGRPVSDLSARCGGPDGRVDVYLETLASPRDGAATTFGASCKGGPSWVLLDPRAPGGVIAHEFMHVLQLTHAQSAPCQEWSYLNEATATWAEDHVYPDGQTEHAYLFLLEDPLVVFGAKDGYPGWVFFKSVTEESGSAAPIAELYAKAEQAPPLVALDAALPGGLDRHWPAFARNGWNRRLDNALLRSFFSWDKLRVAPPAPRRPLALPEGQDVLRTPAQVTMTGLGRQYVDWDLSDTRARHVSFADPSARGIDPGLHADAFVRTADGRWRHEDWTGLAEKEFCRDEPAEDVRQVILIHSTTTLPAAESPGSNVVSTNRPAIELRKSCGEPGRYKVLRASLTTRTEGSQSSTAMCPGGGVSATEDFAASLTSDYLDPDNRLAVEEEDTEASGRIFARAPAQWTTALTGCTRPPPTYAEQPCATSFTDHPEPDGTWGIGFQIEADALDTPTARITWSLQDPSVGYVDAKDFDDVCNVGPIGNHFNYQEHQQTVPMSKFTVSGPVTLSYSGGPRTWSTDMLGQPVSLRMTWSYEITFIRVDENGDPV